MADYCFTNISDPTRVLIYEQAIKNTNAPLRIGAAEPTGGWHPPHHWRGLWGTYKADISYFWREVERLSAKAEVSQ